MAYMSQERKAEIAPKVKAICARYGIKATLAVRHHSTLVLNIKSGKLDFIENYINANHNRHYGGSMSADQVAYIRQGQTLDVNPYWYQEHFSGFPKAFLEEIFQAMNKGNHDNSDIQSDYFDVGWYVDVNIGAWNKPYVFA